MEEEISILYTDICHAKKVMGDLNSSGIRKTYLNTTEFGLHIGINSKDVYKKFPGAFPSTMVKLVVKVDSQDDRDNAVQLLQNSFGVMDQ